MNIFETAVRGKYRFAYKGMLSVEDLMDLSVKDLDAIFKSLNSQLKQTKEESLLDVKTTEDKELDVKIEIVKFIVAEKLERLANLADEKAKKEQKQKILAILSDKKEADLKNKSTEELEKMLAEM